MQRRVLWYRRHYLSPITNTPPPPSRYLSSSSSSSSSKWQTVVGVEVHAQINAQTKLFSAAPGVTSEPVMANSRVHAFDIALPGTLPLLNEECVKQAVRLGLVLNGTVNKRSTFQRKHYFYADLPAGYQITQLAEPIVTGGYVQLPAAASKRVRITRIQLEQDSGKMIHNLHPTRTYVDLNRAGVGLLEIVSEPDMIGADETVLFVRELQSLLKHMNICSGVMANGAMRVDVNVSLANDDGTSTQQRTERVEVKNMRSFRDMIQAIEYERHRQLECLARGEPVLRETRGFDARTQRTYCMRTKEQLLDYRMYPEPDLPPLVVTDSMIDELRASLPPTPAQTRERVLEQYNIAEADATTLVADGDLLCYFEAVVAAVTAARSTTNVVSAQVCANWLLTELMGRLSSHGSLSIQQSPLSATELAQVITMVHDGSISGKAGKDVLHARFVDGDTASVDDIVRTRGLNQVSDVDYVVSLCRDTMRTHADKVRVWHEEPKKQKGMHNFLVGQAIRASKGRANPSLVHEQMLRLLRTSDSNNNNNT